MTLGVPWWRARKGKSSPGAAGPSPSQTGTGGQPVGTPKGTASNKEFWEQPDIPPLPADWDDPDPDVRGMLSSDRIWYYADTVRLISPFNPDLLKPASYPLHLGKYYQVDGEDHELTLERPTLTLPKNSIVFVSMDEAIRLPHYMAARFNLSIELVYKGILLGTGPQVDPGFQGVLSCPLHNISNNSIKLRLGQHIATMDFIKTTPLAEGAKGVVKQVATEDELYARRAELVGYRGRIHVLFDQDRKHRKWRRPITGYAPGEMDIRSSVADLDHRLSQFDKTISNLKRLGIGAAVVGIIGALGFVLSLLNVATGYYQDVKKDVSQLQQELIQMQDKSPPRAPGASPSLPLPTSSR